MTFEVSSNRLFCLLHRCDSYITLNSDVVGLILASHVLQTQASKFMVQDAMGILLIEQNKPGSLAGHIWDRRQGKEIYAQVTLNVAFGLWRDLGVRNILKPNSADSVIPIHLVGMEERVFLSSYVQTVKLFILENIFNTSCHRQHTFIYWAGQVSPVYLLISLHGCF